MAFMEWTPALELGIQQIDSQHKKLVDMMNELHAAMKEGRGAQKGPVIIKKLVDYTEYHFGDEEKFQQSFNYTDFANHKKVHISITAKLRGLEERANAGSTTVQSELLRFMRDWLVGHIQQTDKQYADEFKKKAVSVR